MTHPQAIIPENVIDMDEFKARLDRLQEHIGTRDDYVWVARAVTTVVLLVGQTDHGAAAMDALKKLWRTSTAYDGSDAWE